MNGQSYAMVTTTSPSDAETEKIAFALIQQKLAACVQVLPIKSYYTWQDKMNIEDEHLLLIKGKRRNKEIDCYISIFLQSCNII